MLSKKPMRVPVAMEMKRRTTRGVGWLTSRTMGGAARCSFERVAGLGSHDKGMMLVASSDRRTADEGKMQMLYQGWNVEASVRNGRKRMFRFESQDPGRKQQG